MRENSTQTTQELNQNLPSNYQSKVNSPYRKEGSPLRKISSSFNNDLKDIDIETNNQHFEEPKQEEDFNLESNSLYGLLNNVKVVELSEKRGETGPRKKQYPVF